MSRKLESKMHEAAENGDWDAAINHAKRIPTNFDPWDNLAANYQIPPSHFDKFIKAVPASNRPNVFFEISNNLHPELKHEHLDILGSLDSSFYVQDNIKKHPNWNPLKNTKSKNDMAASLFWYSYEKNVDPHHFAAVKSLYTGKPETIKCHRTGQNVNSHGEHYISYGGTLLDNATFKPPIGNFRIHDEVIPHLKSHAEKVQKAILDDKNIPKRNINGVPHIQLWRGVGGEYAKKLKDAINSGKQRLNIKKMPFSSWTTSREIAQNFAKNRQTVGEKANQESHAVVIRAWVPLDKVLHSGYHSIHTGQKHAHPLEEEIIVGHPEGKMTINSNDIEIKA